ncbi:MAG: hypothetical protein ACJ736_17650 [Streptomyces sp.]
MTTGRQFRVDRGGTFTDIVAPRPDGRRLTDKLLLDDSGESARSSADVGPGDVLVTETPGGGGHGQPSTQHPQHAGEETNDLRAF